MDKISIQEATRSYSEGKVVVFKDLNLDVQENKVLCIVGPSGCGKTTLLRCIDGLIPLSAGRIVIDGMIGATNGARPAICMPNSRRARKKKRTR